MSWTETFRSVVGDDWIDELGHVNFLVYQRIASHGGMAFWQMLCGGRDAIARNGNEYVLIETHVRYLGEIRLGDTVYVETALCAFDDKRFQLMHRVLSEERRTAATVETVSLGFNLHTRRASTFLPDVVVRLGNSTIPDDLDAFLPLKRKGQIDSSSSPASSVPRL